MKLYDLLILSLTVSCVSAIPASPDSRDTNQAPGLVIPEAKKMIMSCLCTDTTGLFCGERAQSRDEHKYITGNCKAMSLYYCSPSAARTAGVAEIVQAPCWAGLCLQLTHHGIGIDTCPDHKTATDVRTTVKPAAATRIPRTVPRDQDSAAPTLKAEPCTCHGSTGHFCGSRRQQTQLAKPITGGCNDTSLYYCSPWAVKTSGLADIVQGPCWTNNCYQSAQLGLDSCTLPGALAEQPNHREQQGRLTNSTSHGNEHPTFQAGLDSRDATKNPTPKSKPDPVEDAECKCGTEYGFYCGNRLLSPDWKIDERSVSGKCQPNTRYWCSVDAAKKQGAALIYNRDQCTSGTHCLINGRGSDYCGTLASNTLLNSEHQSIPDVNHGVPIPRREANNQDSFNRPSNCTCPNNIKGTICGNRQRSMNGPGKLLPLAGDCPRDGIYYCPRGKGEQALVVQAKCATGFCQESTKIPLKDYCL